MINDGHVVKDVSSFITSVKDNFTDNTVESSVTIESPNHLDLNVGSDKVNKVGHLNYRY